MALRFKEDGNLKFKEQKFKEAEGLYRDGLAHIQTVKNENAELKELKVSILVNLALVCNKSKDFKEGVK